MSSTSVYEAERQVFKKRFHGNGHHVHIDQAKELVFRYLGDGWTVRRTYTSRSHSGSWCYPKRKEIHLSPGAGLPLVLHEIAHGLANESGHGLAFQRAYVELVQKEMGDNWATRLVNSFIRHQCKGYKTWIAAKRGMLASCKESVRECSGWQEVTEISARAL